MTRLLSRLALALVLLSPVAVRAQTPAAAARTGADSLAALPPDQRAAHEELTAFRIAIQGAFNRMGASGTPEDMQALLAYVHPDVLFSDMTGRSTRGHAELLEYFRHEFLAPDHSLARMQGTFEADHLSLLLRPDVATNRGTVHGTFAFVNGSEISVDSRWTATIVKHEGRWKVATFHFGPSIFDNPVTNAYKAWIWKAAALAALAGLAIGLLGSRVMWRRRPA
ncbi:MAG: nuclear transport factor 2 family protein [Gemmatimonadetes bacterium]|nr:nuclear transport factor 2 family protein [Gemmatimonadota bacterium]